MSPARRILLAAYVAEVDRRTGAYPWARGAGVALLKAREVGKKSKGGADLYVLQDGKPVKVAESAERLHKEARTRGEAVGLRSPIVAERAGDWSTALVVAAAAMTAACLLVPVLAPAAAATAQGAAALAALAGAATATGTFAGAISDGSVSVEELEAVAADYTSGQRFAALDAADTAVKAGMPPEYAVRQYVRPWVARVGQDEARTVATEWAARRGYSA